MRSLVWKPRLAGLSSTSIGFMWSSLLVAVGGVVEDGVGQLLEQQRGFPWRVEAYVEHLLGDAERQRRMLREFTGDGHRLLHVLAGRGDFGDDTPLLGLPGVESPAAQHQVAGAAGADHPHDPGDAAGG